MPHYLFQASYSQQGVEGILKEGGSSRLGAVDTLVASLGGRVECQYWAFGERDYIMVAELPDNATAAALAATVARTGTAQINTTVLLTGDEIDQLVEKRGEYRAPGT